MLITSQSNHKLHTTGPLFPRCLTFTFSPLNHQQPLSSFFHPLSSNEDMYRSFLWWLFKNSEKRSFSEFFVDVFHNDKRGNYPLFYGFVSTTGALNILVLATSVSQLALRDLAWWLWAVFFHAQWIHDQIRSCCEMFLSNFEFDSWNTQCLICLRFWVAKTFQLLDDVGKDYLCRCLAFRIRNARRSFPNCLTLFLRQKLPFLGQTA